MINSIILKLILSIFFCRLIFFEFLQAQISPPGLGAGKTASWIAIALRQDLDSLKKWQSVTYTGFARKSNPDNYIPTFKPAMFIANQEFYHQFHKKWQYSLALSYRIQNEYIKNKPYTSDNPKIKQEFRLYSRFSHIFNLNRLRIVPTIRQDFRKFFGPHFSHVKDDFQFRSRFRLQFTVNLDEEKKHRIIVGSEQLFAISFDSQLHKWSTWRYRESRFTTYYSLTSKTLPLIFNIGYMNNLVGHQKPFSVHYLALDVFIVNLFSND